MDEPTSVRLVIYSLPGENVFAETLEGGRGLNTLPWNLKNQRGGPVASGLYIYRLVVGGGSAVFSKMGKLIILR